MDKTVKQMQDEKFVWLGNNTLSKNFSQKDISINLIKTGSLKSGKQTYGFSIIFRNEVWKNFGNRIEFAVYKSRIMIRSADNERGILLTKKSDNATQNHYAKLSNLDKETMETFKQFIGDYELKYDSFYELYYIESDKAILLTSKKE